MKKIISLITVSLPVVAFAQTGVIHDVNSLSSWLTSFGNTIIGLLIALAVIFIIYHVVMYLIKGSSEEDARTKAGWNILWGIVGLAIILSIWGLVAILTNSFRTQNQTPVQQFPQVPPAPPVNTRGY